MSAIKHAQLKGRQDGYKLGWTYGYHLGRCENVIRTVPGISQTPRAIRVVYVTAGIGVPYPALDQAIIDGLQEAAAEVMVVNPSDNVAQIAAEQKPDLVLVLNGVVLPKDQVDAIRDKGIKTAVWFTDDPYYTDWTINIAPHYEYIFTLELSCVPFYRQLGCPNVHYLPFAVNPKMFSPKRVDTSYHSDICFIGTAYWNRVELIDRIAPYLSGKRVHISGWWWDRLQHFGLLRNKIRLGDWMSPEETAQYYSGAKIVINLHRAHDDDTINANSRKLPAFSANPRTFEISGCGTLQLTDLRQDMGYCYTPGEDIETYTSPEQLIEKIEHYLGNEPQRRELALRSLRKTLTEHTYGKRLNRMMDIVFNG